MDNLDGLVQVVDWGSLVQVVDWSCIRAVDDVLTRLERVTARHDRASSRLPSEPGAIGGWLAQCVREGSVSSGDLSEFCQNAAFQALRDAAAGSDSGAA